MELTPYFPVSWAMEFVLFHIIQQITINRFYFSDTFSFDILIHRRVVVSCLLDQNGAGPRDTDDEVIVCLSSFWSLIVLLYQISDR